MPTSSEIISNKESKEYSVVRLSKSNLDDLTTLHTAVYGTIVAPGYFLKKYDTAYTGVEHIGFIAYNKDHLAIAYYGVIPCFIQSGNEIILAAQSADTMTHPDHRYKGMFVELSNRTFELCRDLSIQLIFGFPNQHSYHGAVNKLGWKMTEEMSCFIIPVQTLPLESLAGKAGWFKNIYKRYTRWTLSKKLLALPGVANSVTQDGFAGLYRNDEYFSYKSYSLSRVIQIGDSKIWISNKYGLMIGDMEGVTEKNFLSIINKLKRTARRLGIRQIQFHCSPGTNLHRFFAALFKAIPSYPVLFQDFGSAIPPEKIKFTFADIDVF